MGFVDNIFSEKDEENAGFQPLSLDNEYQQVSEQEKRDADLEEQQRQQELQSARDAEPTRSALGEVGTGLYTSAVDVLPQMAFNALAGVASADSDLEIWANEQAAEQERDMQLPTHALQQNRHNKVTNAFAAGAQSAAPTLAIGLVAALPVPGARPAAAGMAMSLFGGSSFNETYQNILKDTGDADLAFKTGLKTGVIDGTLDTAMTVAWGGFLKAAKIGAGGKTVIQALNKMKNPKALKTFAKNLGIMEASEISTEIFQDISTEAIESNATGREHANYMDIAKETGTATAAMTLMLGSLGGFSHIRRNIHNQAIIKTVESAESSADARMEAGLKIYNQLKKVDEKGAEVWAAGVIEAVDENISLDLMNPGDAVTAKNKFDEALAKKNKTSEEQVVAAHQAAEETVPIEGDPLERQEKILHQETANLVASVGTQNTVNQLRQGQTITVQSQDAAIDIFFSLDAAEMSTQTKINDDGTVTIIPKLKEAPVEASVPTDNPQTDAYPIPTIPGTEEALNKPISVDDKPSGVIFQRNGNTYKTEKTALNALTLRKDLNTEDHEIVPHGDGFVIQPKTSINDDLAGNPEEAYVPPEPIAKEDFTQYNEIFDKDLSPEEIAKNQAEHVAKLQEDDDGGYILQLSKEDREEVDKDLEVKLTETLKKHGVDVKVLPSLKKKYGIDALGATDVVKKIVAIKDGRIVESAGNINELLKVLKKEGINQSEVLIEAISPANEITIL